jgi:hypothetical protein
MRVAAPIRVDFVPQHGGNHVSPVDPLLLRPTRLSAHAPGRAKPGLRDDRACDLIGRKTTEFPAERSYIDVVNEGTLAGDLDDGKPLAVARLELVDARDVDLVESALTELGDKRRAGPLAEVALRSVVQKHLGMPRHGFLTVPDTVS